MRQRLTAVSGVCTCRPSPRSSASHQRGVHSSVNWSMSMLRPLRDQARWATCPPSMTLVGAAFGSSRICNWPTVSVRPIRPELANGLMGALGLALDQWVYHTDLLDRATAA